MKKALIAVAISLTFMLSNAQAASAKQEIKMAKVAQKKAKASGFEWRDVGKFIKNAEKALKKGDEKSAIKLAKKAQFQSHAGVQQSKDQAKAGPTF